MSRIRAHLSFANVVALVALFVALGGAALAAGNAFVSSSGVIQGCVKKGALDVVKAGKKCPKHTTSLAFNEKGQPGKNGKNGTGGSGGPPSGAAGGSLSGTYPAPSLAAGAVPLYSTSEPEAKDFTSNTSDMLGIGSLDVGPGTYLVVAKSIMSATASSALRAQSECILESRLGGAQDNADWIAAMAPLDSGGFQADGIVELQLPFTGPGEIDLSCENLSSAGVSISADFTRIDAIKTTSNN